MSFSEAPPIILGGPFQGSCHVMCLSCLSISYLFHVMCLSCLTAPHPACLCRSAIALLHQLNTRSSWPIRQHAQPPCSSPGAGGGATQRQQLRHWAAATVRPWRQQQQWKWQRRHRCFWWPCIHTAVSAQRPRGVSHPLHRRRGWQQQRQRQRTLCTSLLRRRRVSPTPTPAAAAASGGSGCPPHAGAPGARPIPQGQAGCGCCAACGVPVGVAGAAEEVAQEMGRGQHTRWGLQLLRQGVTCDTTARLMQPHGFMWVVSKQHPSYLSVHSQTPQAPAPTPPPCLPNHT
jgi:hypothetical protein